MNAREVRSKLAASHAAADHLERDLASDADWKPAAQEMSVAMHDLTEGLRTYAYSLLADTEPVVRRGFLGLKGRWHR